MSCDMGQGDGPEPVNGLCEEAAGESWLPVLMLPDENTFCRTLSLITELSVVKSLSPLMTAWEHGAHSSLPEVMLKLTVFLLLTGWLVKPSPSPRTSPHGKKNVMIDS